MFLFIHIVVLDIVFNSASINPVVNCGFYNYFLSFICIMTEVKQRTTTIIIIIMITIIIKKASLYLKSLKYNFEAL